MKQWKVKKARQAPLHSVSRGLNSPLPRNEAFSQGNILHPYVFDLLQIIYVHADITITSPDEDVGKV